MSERIGVQQAQAKLPEILRRVAAGESFTITKRGKPVAELNQGPHRQFDRKAVEAAMASIRSLRRPIVPSARLKKMIGRGRT